jgi:hypothetical protein
MIFLLVVRCVANAAEVQVDNDNNPNAVVHCYVLLPAVHASAVTIYIVPVNKAYIKGGVSYNVRW